MKIILTKIPITHSNLFFYLLVVSWYNQFIIYNIELCYLLVILVESLSDVTEKEYQIVNVFFDDEIFGFITVTFLL